MDLKIAKETTIIMLKPNFSSLRGGMANLPIHKIYDSPLSPFRKLAWSRRRVTLCPSAVAAYAQSRRGPTPAKTLGREHPQRPPDAVLSSRSGPRAAAC